MGKTGTTNDFKDALFVGSTYGVDGITVAVRIGFDDGRSLGSRETGGRVALPVFREVMQRVYESRITGAAPSFPRAIEQRITQYLTNPIAGRARRRRDHPGGHEPPAVARRRGRWRQRPPTRTRAGARERAGP